MTCGLLVHNKVEQQFGFPCFSRGRGGGGGVQTTMTWLLYGGLCLSVCFLTSYYSGLAVARWIVFVSVFGNLVSLLLSLLDQ